jgi:hypothetical protein
MSFEANSKSQLLNILRKTYTSITGRTEGRNKKHTERYSIAYLLSTLAKNDLITYPIRLIHRERPDFLLFMNDKKIGIEHTEAISQNEAHRRYLRQIGCEQKTILIFHTKPDERKKNRKELEEEMRNYDGGDGFGDMRRQDWADAMFYTLGKKISIFKKEGFEKFDENWLIIYDNWQIPCINLEEVSPFLMDLICKNDALKEFSRVFVKRYRQICEFSTAGFTIHEINDLWK